MHRPSPPHAGGKVLLLLEAPLCYPDEKKILVAPFFLSEGDVMHPPNPPHAVGKVLLFLEGTRSFPDASKHATGERSLTSPSPLRKLFFFEEDMIFFCEFSNPHSTLDI